MEDLSLDALCSRIRGTWGSSLTVKQSTASTMDDAAAAAAQGAEDGHVVLADQQTHGRGAHGRHWVSPPGTDLYFSIVTHPAVEPASTALITLAAGLGLRDAVADLVPDRAVLVKWPNDIWIERRKCAGILVETRTVGARIDAVIIGVGLNVNRTQWPSDIEHIATSLRAEREGQEPFDRGAVFASALAHMERWVGSFIRDGEQPVIDALRTKLALVGERVRWEDGRGVFEGIDPHGAARIRTTTGAVSLHAAHIEPVER
ncbi:MAG: biotin--[acetyl-CoA-carboxylase] ligase [Myxococcales bacterium]|jgi:BirA family biotin operon repressor/biotin-[acetyl-CoA-carboxylase] ligase